MSVPCKFVGVRAMANQYGWEHPEQLTADLSLDLIIQNN